MGKKSVRVFLLTLAVLLPCVTPVCGQDASGPRPKRQRTPDGYKPRSLKEVAAERPGEESRGN
jgi:hypothetical protein